MKLLAICLWKQGEWRSQILAEEMVGLCRLELQTSTVSRWNSIARLLILLGDFTAFGGGKRLWERLSQRYRSVQRCRPSSLPYPFGIGRSA